VWQPRLALLFQGCKHHVNFWWIARFSRRNRGRKVAQEGNTFVLYRDLGDGYRWRLRGPDGQTLAESAHGHEEKAHCEEEMRAAMADHPGAEVLDVTVASESG
jgi:uncharacterized protein YegP (UPF0339 family)